MFKDSSRVNESLPLFEDWPLSLRLGEQSHGMITQLAKITMVL